jgi:hypothetical protein
MNPSSPDTPLWFDPDVSFTNTNCASEGSDIGL